jgi:serine/threonine protein phosphatase PrpC
MFKKEKNFFKGKKREIKTPGILAKKPVPIFRGSKKDYELNRPKSKNMIQNNQNNFHTHFGFYLKQQNNPKKINLQNNNINNLNMLLNKKNIHINKNIFSEEKNNNKKIFLAHNLGDNKNINNINIIKFNNDLPKSEKKKEININNPNIINKVNERNDINNKNLFHNKINIIRIEDKKNKNLNDIFPKIKKGSQFGGNLNNINISNNLDKIIKNNDLKMIQNVKNKKKNIKIVLPNNSNNIININNNNHNLDKNMRYFLKNKPIKKEENQLININKNIFNNNNEKKFLYKLNINNNIIINKPRKIGKSSDHYVLNKNNNNLAFKNIILNKNGINKLNYKRISVNEEKISDTSLDKILHLKDYYIREEINSKIKEEMEDYTLVKHPFLNIEKHNLSLFCIFDGHGGDFVSKYLKENFASNLHKNIKINYSLNFRNILKTSIESIDKELEKLKEAENCGSTGTIVVLDNNSVYCANVGDSKCFYINKKNNAFQLTEDHNCSNQKEKEELKKKGIIIFQNRVFGSLSLTRTFGDTQLKKDGIECNPYIKKIFLDRDEVKYIIIASDGIWDAVNKEKLMEIYKEVENGTSKEFCNKLVDFAMNNGSNDNISCIVLRF